MKKHFSVVTKRLRHRYLIVLYTDQLCPGHITQAETQTITDEEILGGGALAVTKKESTPDDDHEHMLICYGFSLSWIIL